MLAIGIHGQGMREAARGGGPQPGQDRRALPLIFGLQEHAHARITGGAALKLGASAIGAAVDDDPDRIPLRARFRHRRE